MKILYGYTNCTNKKYAEIFSGKNVSALLADQKYHSLLIDGLNKNGAKVKCVSGLPINRGVTKKLFISEKDEEENGVTYHYIKTINLPLFRQLGIYFGTRRFFEKNVKKGEKDAFAVCDCLNLANAYAMLKSAKKKNVPIVFIVTDIPEFQRGKFLKKINDKIISGADGFVLLTEQMNEKINPEKKPFIVAEGHSDGALESVDKNQKYENKTGKKVVIYAGSIQKLYGIQNLVEGFIKADIPSSELKIYGDGDYREELEKICGKSKNVVYMGVKANSEIVEDEQRAALLVNPRPSSPEYTKYSFPSKTMEYMASGTPVLTTKLPGIPKEYYPHVYFIEDESAEGVKHALEKTLSISIAERKEKGERAREFVLKEKSNVTQAKKIIGFLEKITR